MSRPTVVLVGTLDTKGEYVHEVDAHINDPEFAVAMAARLDDFLGGAR